MVFEIVQLVTKRTTTLSIDFEMKISFKLKFQINMIKQYKILFVIHRYNELGYIYITYIPILKITHDLWLQRLGNF